MIFEITYSVVIVIFFSHFCQDRFICIYVTICELVHAVETVSSHFQLLSIWKS